MKKAIYSLFLAFMFLSSCSFMKNSKDYKIAEQQFGMMNFEVAIDHYTLAWEREESPSIARGLARSYSARREFDLAESWYAKLGRMGELEGEDRVTYARALIANSKFEEAYDQLGIYEKEGGGVGALIRNLQSTAKVAKSLLNTPQNLQIKNLTELNSVYSDFGGIIRDDRLLFTSDRISEVGSGGRIHPYNALKSERYGWTGNGYLQVYEAKGDWDKFVLDSLYAVPHLKSRYHSGPIDESDQLVFITKTDDKGLSGSSSRFTIYPKIVYREVKNGVFGEEQELPINKPEQYTVSDPFWDATNQRLYFSSNKEGGYGDADLYYITYLGEGQWLEAVRLDDAVNSMGNERTPYIDAKGDLYFSSDGWGGLGGLDIYKSERQGEKRWGSPENLGAPINSTRDDFFFQFHPQIPDRGLFSSDREGGKGMDELYAFVLEIESNIYLNGVVRDKETLQPLRNAVVELMDRTTGTNYTYVTDEEGQFEFVLHENATYDLEGRATDYITASIKDISTEGLRVFEDTAIVKELLLDKIEIGRTIVLENIYYDFDKWEIRDDAALELDKLVRILKDNPTMKIDLNSHTDARGSDTYNQTLSEKRAKSAVDYLISQGIAASRLQAKGYGESRPINACVNGVECPEEAHQQNRRTEFTIVGY
jgi:outer membrane protein OmpA-like peptidoglycan-associated protein